MAGAYNVVDAGRSVGRYRHPAFHDRAPHIVRDNATGKERLIIKEHTSDARLSIGRVGAVEACQGLVEPDATAYRTASPAISTRMRRMSAALFVLTIRSDIEVPRCLRCE